MSVIKRYLSIVILVFLVAWCVIYVRGHIDEFKSITQISIKFSLILVFMSLTIITLRGYFTKVLLEPFKIDLKLKEWLGLSFVSTMGNYLTPFRTGAGLRAVYLKSNYDFSYSSFLSTMAATYIINFLVNSLTGMISMGLIYVSYRIFNLPIFLFFLIIFLILTAIIALSPKVLNQKKGFLKIMSNLINGWYQIRTNRTVLKKLFLLILLNAGALWLNIFFAFKAFSVNLALIKCLLISAFHSFSILISITPGSLGISEGDIVFTSKLFGIGTAEGILVAGLIRVSTMFWVLTLGPVCSYCLFTRKTTKPHTTEKEKTVNKARKDCLTMFK